MPTRDERILELSSQYSAPTIAKMLQIGKRTVYRVLKNNNIDYKTTNINRIKTLNSKITELYLSKKSCLEIGQELNIDAETVRYHLKKSNIQRRSNYEAFSILTTEEIQYIINTYPEKSSYQLADELNVNYQVVQGLIKKKGLSIGSFSNKWKELMLSGLKNGQSKLEFKVAEILQNNNIKFTQQHVIDNFKYDFLLPDHKLIIEANGSYWHSTKERANKDRLKRKLAINDGYKYLVIWDFEFLKPNYAENKILRIINPIKDELIKNEYNVKLITKEESHKILYWHYQGKVNAKYHYGLFRNNILIGTITLSSPHRLNIGDCFNGKSLELTRLCILPEYQIKNLATFFMSKVIKLLKTSEYVGLISFSDPTFGHDGTIYKASNWFELSKTGYNYFYVSRKVGIIHKKTIWNKSKKINKTESETAKELGLIKVTSQPKTKWIYKLK